MKEITGKNAPEQPKKKRPKMDPQKKDKLVTKIIMIVIGVILIAFVIKNAIPEKTDTPNGSDTSSGSYSEQQQQTPQTPDTSGTPSANPGQTNSDITPDTNANTGENTFGDYAGTVYYVIEPGTEHARTAHMFVPAAYKAQPITGGVQLLQAEADPNVDGTEPMTFIWQHTSWMDRTIQNGVYDLIAEAGATGFKTYKYELTDQYQTCDLDGNPQPVYIVSLTKIYEDPEVSENSEEPQHVAYVILGKASDSDRYFMGIVDDFVTESLYTQRYPDLSTLSRAIFPEYNGHPDANGKTIPDSGTTNQNSGDASENTDTNPDETGANSETPPPNGAVNDDTNANTDTSNP